MEKTILYDLHCALSAKMTPFGGFLMPLQYEGIIAEHQAARTGTAVFDTCHMGEFKVSGPNACGDLEKLVTPVLSTLAVGRCRYFFMLNENGGVIDDLIIYRMGEDDFFIVVNAGTQAGDFEWISNRLSGDTKIENISAETAKIDVQGPGSAKVVQKMVDAPIADMKFYSHTAGTYKGREILLSRTGYTGEIGFELYCDNDIAADVWNESISLGAKPAGLGSRDTLRLEMCLPLHGHELTPERNAAEAGFDWMISSEKDYIGSSVVLAPERRNESLTAIELEGRRAAREGNEVLDDSGSRIGSITSGCFSPSLGKAVALAYLGNDAAEEGKALRVGTGRMEIAGRVVARPFYKEATGRKALKNFL